MHVNANTLFLAATGGVLLLGAFGYFVVPPLLEDVGVSHEVATVPVHEVAAVSTAVPTTPSLPSLEEGMPNDGAAKVRKIASTALLGAGSHVASGTVLLLGVGSTTYLRYEGLEADNGPDLHVYLSEDMTAGGGDVDLGVIKTTHGDVNYEIPETVDINEYPYVLTWSKSFGVLFNYAKLR